MKSQRDIDLLDIALTLATQKRVPLKHIMNISLPNKCCYSTITQFHNKTKRFHLVPLYTIEVVAVEIVAAN